MKDNPDYKLRPDVTIKISDSKISMHEIARHNEIMKQFEEKITRMRGILPERMRCARGRSRVVGVVAWNTATVADKLGLLNDCNDHDKSTIDKVCQELTGEKYG